MTTEEAFDLTLETIEDLKKEGVLIEITPYKHHPEKGEETKKKYSGPERAKPERWCRAKFNTEDETHRLKIREATNYLGSVGISFDTGGMAGSFDWELDWSFKYSGKPDEEWRQRNNQVQDIISGMGKESCGEQED